MTVSQTRRPGLGVTIAVYRVVAGLLVALAVLTGLTWAAVVGVGGCRRRFGSRTLWELWDVLFGHLHHLVVAHGDVEQS